MKIKLLLISEPKVPWDLQVMADFEGAEAKIESIPLQVSIRRIIPMALKTNPAFDR